MAQVPIALRACTGFVISIDAGVLRALMGGRVLIGVGPGCRQVGVRALRALLVPRLCTTSCSMRQAIAPWLIQSRALALSLKIVGDQGGYTSLESANKALKDSKGECKDVVGAEAEAKFKAAQAKARRDGVETLTQKDIEGLSLEQIKQLRGY